MRIGVQGNGDRRVSEHLGDDLGGDTGQQHQGRRSVPQIVEPDARQVGLRNDLVKPEPADIATVQRMSTLIAEDEIQVCPRWPGCETLGELTNTVTAEHVDYFWAEQDLALAMLGLGLGEDTAAALASHAKSDLEHAL